jgi:hypothetical protein
MEVDIADQDALRMLKEIERSRTVGLKSRENATVPPDCQAYQITADGTPVGLFLNMFVNGTWCASANVDLGEI